MPRDAALAPTGYFGPLSVRVKGLFKMHTRTGNLLVDSVAEHQPARPTRTGGTSTTRITSRRSSVPAAHYAKTRDASALFLPLYALTAYYFATTAWSA